MRSIRERIGAGVATGCERGHVESVETRLTVDRVEVAIGTGGRFNCSPSDCVVICSVIGSSGSVTGKRVGGGIGAFGCRVGGAVGVFSVNGGNR